MEDEMPMNAALPLAMTFDQWSTWVMVMDRMYAEGEISEITARLAAGYYPADESGLRAGRIHMTRADAEGRITKMRMRLANPRRPDPALFDALSSIGLTRIEQVSDAA
jgi:hypothetical protein